jgi:hypothetical protein
MTLMMHGEPIPRRFPSGPETAREWWGTPLDKDLPIHLFIKIYGERVYTERLYDAIHVGEVGSKRMQRADSDDHLKKFALVMP